MQQQQQQYAPSTVMQNFRLGNPGIASLALDGYKDAAPILDQYGSLWYSKVMYSYWRPEPNDFYQPPEIDEAIEHAKDPCEILADPATDLDTLMYAFFFMPASGVQATAAAVLYDRGWRWYPGQSTEGQILPPGGGTWVRLISYDATHPFQITNTSECEIFNVAQWKLETTSGRPFVLTDFAPRPPIALPGQPVLVTSSTESR